MGSQTGVKWLNNGHYDPSNTLQPNVPNSGLIKLSQSSSIFTNVGRYNIHPLLTAQYLKKEQNFHHQLKLVMILNTAIETVVLQL
jgi:hypothetical protein